MATDSSIEPKQGSPSFFKVVRYPSAPHLSLPIAFVRRYFNKIPKNTTLKTATGEHSWRLKIKKIDEDYCFADGWEKLAIDVQLSIRDIIVFWLIDSYTFQVSFFEEHGCEKDLPLTNTSDCEHENGDDGDEDDDDVTQDEDLYFQKVISEKNHKYYMLLPKKFVDAAGLENKSSIKLRDNEGKEWKIGLRTEIYGNTRLYLSTGWPLFRKRLDLCDGDMCLFKYMRKEGVLILAELIKSKRPAKRETPVDGLKRKVGRSPIEKIDVGGGGVKVKVEYDSDPEVEVLKRKRRRSPVVEKQCGGDAEVKIEDESWTEVKVMKKKKKKKKKGTPPVGEPCGGGGGVKVKIEDESCPFEVEVVREKRGGPPAVKACGGERKTEPEKEKIVRYRQVIYF